MSGLAHPPARAEVAAIASGTISACRDTSIRAGPTALDGMALPLECHGTTTLTGSLVDQAALQGLLARIRDLGLSIVSIQRFSPEGEVGNS